VIPDHRLCLSWYTARRSQGSSLCSMKIYSVLQWYSGKDVVPPFVDDILLRSLSNSEEWEVLKEAYDKICGAHQSGSKLKFQLHRLDNYWLTMIADAVEYAKRCKVCQNHTDFIHKTPELLHPTVASWPFKAWRIDVLGTISPPSTKGHWFILAITN